MGTIEEIDNILKVKYIPVRQGDRHKIRKYRSTERPLLDDIITDVIYDGPNNRHCYLIDHMPDQSYIRLHSENNQGLYHVSRHHLVHSSASKSETYIESSIYPEYREIREAVQRLTGWSDSRLSYHPAGNARNTNRWLHLFMPKVSRSQLKILLPDYSCRELSGPIQLDCAYYHDMVNAYWQIAEAIPHPFVYIDRHSPNGLRYMKLGERIYNKWRTMIETMKPHKKACKAIIGNWVAGYSAERYFAYSTRRIYHKGKFYKAPQDKRNTLNTFGLLVVRITKELTQEEYLRDNAHLAYVDCVIGESPIATYWKEQNVLYATKGHGHTDIVNIFCHKVGERKTEPYKDQENRNKVAEKYNGRPTDLEALARRFPNRKDFQEMAERNRRLTQVHAPRIPRDQYYHTHLTFGG